MICFLYLEVECDGNDGTLLFRVRIILEKMMALDGSSIKYRTSKVFELKV